MVIMSKFPTLQRTTLLKANFIPIHRSVQNNKGKSLIFWVNGPAGDSSPIYRNMADFQEFSTPNRFFTGGATNFSLKIEEILISLITQRANFSQLSAGYFNIEKA